MEMLYIWTIPQYENTPQCWHVFLQWSNLIKYEWNLPIKLYEQQALTRGGYPIGGLSSLKNPFKKWDISFWTP